MRNMGGFFIRRKLGDFSPQNELYRVVMNEVCSLLLVTGLLHWRLSNIKIALTLVFDESVMIIIFFISFVPNIFAPTNF